MSHCGAVLLAVAAAVGAGVQGLEAERVFAGAALPLAAAVAAGDAARVRALAGGPADVNAQGRDGVTLLQWALLNKSVAGLQVLLEAGADAAAPGVDGATVLHLAAAAEDPACLRVLLARRVDPNLRHARTGATPLMAALMAERPVQARLLLEAGADPNAADAQGDTALHVAAKINDAGALLRLLQAGADAQTRNARGVGFQRYLAMTPERVLSNEERQRREAVYAWLDAHGVAREPERR
jgi:uncharacterized protein